MQTSRAVPAVTSAARLGLVPKGYPIRSPGTNDGVDVHMPDNNPLERIMKEIRSTHGGVVRRIPRRPVMSPLYCRHRLVRQVLHEHVNCTPF